jgi:hypothetical protein
MPLVEVEPRCPGLLTLPSPSRDAIRREACYIARKPPSDVGQGFMDYPVA